MKKKKTPADEILERLERIEKLLIECCDASEEDSYADYKDQEKKMKEEPKRSPYRSPLM